MSNRDGTEPVADIGPQHHDCVAALPDIAFSINVYRDGRPERAEIVFDREKIFPYAYRHAYTQRHADAGVPVDVLCRLMDHRDLSTTQRHYRVGDQRRREAVDRVTSMRRTSDGAGRPSGHGRGGLVRDRSVQRRVAADRVGAVVRHGVGVLRHYWVIAKLLITVVATVLLLVLVQPVGHLRTLRAGQRSRPASWRVCVSRWSRTRPPPCWRCSLRPHCRYSNPAA
ncbi:hypothetical protein [Streptomyces erythrochromogenes]|uniref:hypothetical protein n=1 Tax=Streptomyces erythrochromogenes TaxID=285574 RepID=UPI00381E3132